MLRFDRPLERTVGPAALLPSRLPRNSTWSWRRIKRLKDLERENATLKRVLVDAEVERAVSHLFSACWGSASSSPAASPGNIKPPQRHEPVTAALLRSGCDAPVQKSGQSITRKCNVFGADKGFECHSAAGTMATATGRSRADPCSVTPLRAAWQSRSAGTHISRHTRCRGVQHRLQGRRCPPSEHR